MNPDRRSPGLGSPILEQLACHATAAIAAAQLVRNRLGLDENAVRTLLEDNFSTWKQTSAIT